MSVATAIQRKDKIRYNNIMNRLSMNRLSQVLCIIIFILWASGCSPPGEGQSPEVMTPRQEEIFSRGTPEQVEELIRESPQVLKMVDSHGRGPMHLACGVEVLKVLREAGASIEAGDADLWAPLHYAVYRDDLPAVEYLIEKGAPVNAVNSLDVTPVFLARSLPVLKMLVEKGAHVNARHKKGGTPLHNAPNIMCAEFLLENGALADVPDNDGMTPLHIFCEKGNLPVVRLLVSRGASLETRDLAGDAPLHNAVYYEHAEIAEFLIKSGAQVNPAKEDGGTPLHDASGQGNADMVAFLINAGADVNLRDKSGQTPLFFAAKEGHVKTVEILLSAGADSSITGLGNMTPAEVARDRKKFAVARILDNFPKKAQQ